MQRYGKILRLERARGRKIPPLFLQQHMVAKTTISLNYYDNNI